MNYNKYILRRFLRLVQLWVTRCVDIKVFYYYFAIFEI